MGSWDGVGNKNTDNINTSLLMFLTLIIVSWLFGFFLKALFFSFMCAEVFTDKKTLCLGFPSEEYIGKRKDRWNKIGNELMIVDAHW